MIVLICVFFHSSQTQGWFSSGKTFPIILRTRIVVASERISLENKVWKTKPFSFLQIWLMYFPPPPPPPLSLHRWSHQVLLPIAVEQFLLSLCWSTLLSRVLFHLEVTAYIFQRNLSYSSVWTSLGCLDKEALERNLWLWSTAAWSMAHTNRIRFIPGRINMRQTV